MLSTHFAIRSGSALQIVTAPVLSLLLLAAAGPAAADGTATWLQGQKLLPSVPSQYDTFSNAVIQSGASAFIGAPGTTANGLDHSGLAYVYANNGGTWTLVQTLAPNAPVAGAQFGNSLATDGTHLFVGAASADNYAGTVYVFTLVGGVWTQTQQLFASDGGAAQEFGNYIVYDNGQFIITANKPNSSGPGEAYVFTDNGGTWTEIQHFGASNGSTNNYFGDQAAAEGNTLVITAHGVNGDQGAAYVFTNSGGVWSQTQELSPTDSGGGTDYGSSVFLMGGALFIGATDNENGNLGKVYVYANTGGVWQQTQELRAADGTGSRDSFGGAVAAVDNTLLVGAANAVVGGNSSQGAVYVFDGTSGTWMQSVKLSASDGQTNDNFGGTVSFDGTIALVGTPNVKADGVDIGAEYVFSPADLGLALDAPAVVAPRASFTASAILTNDATSVSPALAVVLPTPANATLLSATSGQGTCALVSGTATCTFSGLPANGGMATVAVTLQAGDVTGAVIDTSASLVAATPALTADATTTVEVVVTANPGTLSTQGDGWVNGMLTASNTAGTPTNFFIVDKPAHGTVVLTDASTGAFRYRADPSYQGRDSFTFAVTASGGNSAPATVSIIVKLRSHRP